MWWIDLGWQPGAYQAALSLSLLNWTEQRKYDEHSEIIIMGKTVGTGRMKYSVLYLTLSSSRRFPRPLCLVEGSTEKENNQQWMRLSQRLLETNRLVQFPDTQWDVSQNAERPVRIPCEASLYHLSKVLDTRGSPRQQKHT